MHTQGTIRRWDSGKGFGFIQGAHSSNVFFHIRDFRGTTPPIEGMQVEYEEIQVGGKGPRAMDVRPRSARVTSSTAASTARPAVSQPMASAFSPPAAAPLQRSRPAARRRTRAQARDDAPAGAGLAMVLMLGWLALLAWGGWVQRFPLWLLGAMTALNLLTFLSYALDKSAAQRGTWRTSEKQLHLLALLGGWPAAWWAQQWLRHKSRKPEFRSVYWATVLLNCAAVGVVVLRPELLHFQ
ncbi:DUF1294 domain-containing protein [Alicycliphilus sp. T452]|jgi:uncharacterized membrane protein YsdA (DUF1294 family)/cold shock CspA family protein